MIYEHSTDSQKYKPNVGQTFAAFMKREFKFMPNDPSIHWSELAIYWLLEKEFQVTDRSTHKPRPQAYEKISVPS